MTGDRKIDHIEDDLTRAPCVRYDCVYSIKDVSTVKIQIDYNDGSPSQKANCYVYNNEYGAECFITVKKKFDREMQALNADQDDYWMKWNSCLDMTAFATWESQTQGIVPAQRTIARWQMETTAFLRPMATSSGRDHLYAYLRHPNFKKPHDETIEQWNARTDALLDVAAEMEGIEPVLNPQGRKKIKFESYDSNWRSQFTLSNNYNTMSEGDMIQWFKDKKLDADKHEKKRKRAQGRGGGFHRGRSRGGRGNQFGRSGYMRGGRFAYSPSYSQYNSQGRSGNFNGRSYQNYGGYRGGSYSQFGRGRFPQTYQRGGGRFTPRFGGANQNSFGRGRSNYFRGNPRGFQAGRASAGREAYAYNNTAGRVAAHSGRVAYGGTHHDHYQQQQHPDQQLQGYDGEAEMHHMDVGPNQAYNANMEMEMFAYDNSGTEYYDDGSGDGYFGQGW